LVEGTKASSPPSAISPLIPAISSPHTLDPPLFRLTFPLGRAFLLAKAFPQQQHRHLLHPFAFLSISQLHTDQPFLLQPVTDPRSPSLAVDTISPSPRLDSHTHLHRSFSNHEREPSGLKKEKTKNKPTI